MESVVEVASCDLLYFFLSFHVVSDVSPLNSEELYFMYHDSGGETATERVERE